MKLFLFGWFDPEKNLDPLTEEKYVSLVTRYTKFLHLSFKVTALTIILLHYNVTGMLTQLHIYFVVWYEFCGKQIKNQSPLFEGGTDIVIYT